MKTILSTILVIYLIFIVKVNYKVDLFLRYGSICLLTIDTGEDSSESDQFRKKKNVFSGTVLHCELQQLNLLN